MTGGLGTPSPSRFPYPGRPDQQGVAPSSGQVIRARQVIVSGHGDGIFVYTGRPRLGNPPIAWMGGGLVDPYGNVLPSTTGVASSGSFQAGNSITNANGTFTYSGSIPQLGQLIYSNAFAGGTDSAGNIYPAGIAIYQTASGTQPTLVAAMNPITGNIQFGAGTPANPGTAILNGGGTLINSNIYAFHPGTNNQETWQAINPLLNGWANDPGNVTAQYRMVGSPPVSVEVIGTLLATAATSNIFFTLPAAYRPQNLQQFASMGTGGVPAGEAPYVSCDAGGNLRIGQGTIGAANVYGFHGFISLDA